MIADYDLIYEEDGPLLGFLLYPEKGGSIDPTEVDDFLNGAEAADELYDTGGAFEVVETHVRKVPTDNGWTRYVYSGPGRGARRCLRVEKWSQWSQWCMNHIYEPAQTGIPVGRVLDPIWPMVIAHIVAPERRRTHARGPQDQEGVVYLCRECARNFREREEAETARRMEAYRAERAREPVGA